MHQNTKHRKSVRKNRQKTIVFDENRRKSGKLYLLNGFCAKKEQKRENEFVNFFRKCFDRWMNFCVGKMFFG